jgi:hypothetical protein
MSVMEHDRIAAGARLLEHAATDGAVARLLGGVAIAMRCPSAREDQRLARVYGDLDLVVGRRSGGAVAAALERHGYRPHREFNAAHGRTRMLFDEPEGGGDHVDVFVGTFAMCHTLELDDRLRLDEGTLSLADLLLTKLQIAQLNRKDLVDTVALLLDHELTDTPEQGIDVGYVERLLGGDWGWWRTVTGNVATLLEHLPSVGLDADAAATVEARARRLLERVDAAPKSRRWRLRARVGERMPWREEPEEPDE